ncbi:MAG: type II toxin-antitoxin system RelE/ParE family toxin [Bacteroides sp.]|nr:type II toxin-antitoxin system RelE/ParE family toxin [Bacteroides sp.]
MKKIVWSRPAIRGLKNIHSYYLTKNEKYADRLYRQIYKEVHLLADFPFLAPVESLLSGESETYRSLVVEKNFKVIYYIEDEVINIVEIWDCRQDPDRLKESIK